MNIVVEKKSEDEFKDKKFFNYKMCAACKGECCKRHAGSYAPSDFKEAITPELIVKLLNSNKYTIDWWDGDARKGKDEFEYTYYLRPRHVKGQAIEGSWGGVCINWSQKKGCSLTEENRPFQCKKLVPNYNFKTEEADCVTKKKDKATKQDMCIRWIPYQHVLKEAVYRMREI